MITANKGPAAFAYRELARDAKQAKRRFLFEGAVMDGIPIFNLVRETLPAVAITGFRGVVNSTTNYMLTAMEQGQSFDAALAEMQARGIAEADPRLDVDGWDAAAKPRRWQTCCSAPGSRRGRSSGRGSHRTRAGGRSRHEQPVGA